MNCSRQTLTAHPEITCVALSGPSHSTHGAVALYAVVDRSGSMSANNKLRNVILSLEQLLTYLTTGDFFTVLAFDHLVTNTIEREDCSPDHKVVMQQRLDALRPGGSTNLEAAIKAGGAALDHVLPLRTGPVKKAVVLLTDGEATAGELSPVRLLEFQQAIQTAHPDAQLSAIGYGDDHNVALVQSLAISGTYSIVRTVEDVAAVFGDILGGLRSATAQAVKVIVPPHVNQKTTLKQTVRADGSKEIFIGNIIAGGDQRVVLEGLTAADPVRLEYTRVADGVDVVVENVVITEPTEESQTLGTLALLRCEVVSILGQVQGYLLSGGAAIQGSLLERIATLKASLESLSETSTQQMLLRELSRAHTYLTMPSMPPSMSRQVSNMLSQHTQVLGTARGIMSSGGDEEEEDPSRNVSMFASPLQRTISIGMSEAVRSAPPNSVTSENPPSSLFISPATSRTTTTVFPPPPTPGPLHRS